MSQILSKQFYLESSKKFHFGHTSFLSDPRLIIINGSQCVIVLSSWCQQGVMKLPLFSTSGTGCGIQSGKGKQD